MHGQWDLYSRGTKGGPEVSDKPKTMSFSVFRFKEHGKKAVEYLSEPETCHHHAMKSGNTSHGTLFVRKAARGPASWLFHVTPFVDKKPAAYTETSAAVWVLPLADATYAISFGFGRGLLTPGTFEENFGLRVCLNVIDPAKIRSIDRKSFDGISKHAREQLAKGAEIQEFGIDPEKDLVRAIVGQPLNGTQFGKRIAGMDAVAVRVARRPEEIPVLVGELHDAHGSDAYKKQFSWVDHIGETRDKSQIDALNGELVTRISKKALDKIWLVVPEVIDWEDNRGFSFQARKNAEVSSDLHINDWLALRADSDDLSLERLKRSFVYTVSSRNDVRDARWTLFQCLYAEVELSGEKDRIFVLTGGKWFRVDESLVKSVSSEIEALPNWSYNLPEFDHDTEGAYNEAVASASAGYLANVDKKLIRHGPGNSRIELCDLFSSNKEFVHVKRYGGSATLSHLFSQGLVSGELLRGDAKFRDKAKKKLAPSHVHLVGKRPNDGEFTVVFAVVSRSKTSLAKSLPFFSRLTLRNVAARLERLGFKVALSKIENKRAKTKRARSANAHTT